MSDVEKGLSSSSNGIIEANRPPNVTVIPRPTRIANPGTLGLFSFASTTFILSMYNVQTRGIKAPNVVVGMAIFCGGLTQLLAGMWEFPRGNAFGGTAFSSYGAFWMSYATIFIPNSGILDAYGTDASELSSALAVYLFAWMIVTVLFFITSLRKSASFIALFGCLSVTFMLLACSELSASSGKATISVNLAKSGGAFGIITAFIAYYVGLSELLASEAKAVTVLPIGAF
ncbi:related to FUN34-transmembrane protein involved in ammonia production [Armillaria ostoyae]|uniref:Related to FUN34-transmembrane protein involved in ammonia production n=1 Tax=Armillaria ostoyae TaxID=47428 RepID=A0A284RUW9_ARMOS|nr:related to FUN34-transmembrane protein involved in ammonia production [Armillaria ostoyae]